MSDPTGSLPHVPPPTRAGLRAFEVRSGQPAAVGAIYRALGPLRGTRLLLAFAFRQAVTDPLSGLPDADPDDIEEWMARRQFAPVVLLDDALRIDMGMSIEDAVVVLREVVGATGAKFLGSLFPDLDPAVWAASPPAARESLVRRTFRRFGNIVDAHVHLGDREVGFDVLQCRFADYCRQVDRLHLAPLFCHADAVFFEDPNNPYSLTRPGTLATGAPHCAFRLRFKNAPGEE